MPIKTKQDLADKQDGIIGPWNLRDIANTDETPLGRLLIFKGTGKRIPDKELKHCDSRVVIPGERMVRHLWNSPWPH